VASKGYTQTAECLLHYNTDVNKLINYDGSPLYLAYLAGCSHTVESYLKYGAYVNSKDKD